ncbi:MAG: phosphate/phosphite/phosphonate ABC transporter substrate-binding protein [Elainellaceae cyanobacterium]
MKRVSHYLFNRISVLIGLCILLVIPAACSSNSSSTGSANASADAPTDQNSDNTVQVGVLVIRDIETSRQQYEPLVKFLSEKTGRSFILVPLTQESQFLEVEQGRIDFVISNPLAAVQIQRLYDTEFVATQSLPESGAEFGGQIVVRSDSNITSLNDLRGRKGACVSLETAAAGCLFQILHLQQKGINPFLSFDSLREIPSQNDIVQSVLNGTIDFGFIRTGQIESMVNSGLISNVDELRVLEAQQDNFQYEHTTRLYPTWPIAATASAQPQLVEAVKQALLEMPPDTPALEAAGVEKFVPAADYAAVDQLIEELQLRSWDAR